MTIKNLPTDARTREKLLARGPGALSDAELLAPLLRTGIRGNGVVLPPNHPSGSVQPSSADKALTQTLKAALAPLDVRVLDHVIIGTGEALSMAERGLL